jgi:hypothetical protein
LRAAVLDERTTDTLFVCKRARKAAGLPGAILSEWGEQSSAERAIQPRIARRRAEEKREDTLFVCERRRSRRVPSAIRSERSEPFNRVVWRSCPWTFKIGRCLPVRRTL